MRTRPRGAARRRAGSALAVLGLCLATGCGAEQGADSGADRAAREPAGWQPWQTSFHGGGRDDGPLGEVNSCTRGLAPGSDDQPSGTRRAAAKGPLYCDGTRFRDQPLRVRDGAHQPKERKPERRSDFARAGGMVFVDGRSDDAPAAEAGALDGEREVRGLDEKSREQVWDQPVRTSGVHHAADGGAGSILGDERTAITNRPEDGDYEDWSPVYEPGGDVISWDARTGKEQWRLKTPRDQWCSPVVVAGHPLVTCEDDQQREGTLTWYRLDAGKGDGEPSMKRLYQQRQHPQDGGALGVDAGALVFLPTERDYGDREFTGLVRVDLASGEQRTKPLPDAVRKGASPQLIAGDVYFEQPGSGSDRKEQELLVVDAGSGAERWQESTGMKHPSDPVVSTRRDEVYLVDPAGRLVAFDRESGDERWRTERNRAEDGGTNPGEMDAHSSVTLVRDVLVVSTGNTVYSVSPTEPEAKPRDTHRVDLG